MTDAGAEAPTASLTGARSRVRRWFRGLDDLLEAERERWLIWTPALIGTGVAIYFSLRTEPDLKIGLLRFGLAALMVLACRRRPSLMRIMAVLALVAGGFLAAELRAAQVAAPVLDGTVGPTRVTGRVAEVELLEKSARILLADVSVDGLDPDATPLQVRVRLTPRSDIPKLGETVELRAQLFAPPAPAAPGAHDFRRDLYFQRIGAVGYSVRRFVEDRKTGDDRGPRLGRLRQAAAERISAVLSAPDATAERAIALALLVGERGPIPETVNGQMRDAGLAHLLAISGMNITIAAGLIYFTLRLALAAIPSVALRFPIKKIAAAGGLLGAIAYTEFVGAPVSAERSMITTSFLMLAVMLDRNAITLRLVAISATLLILFEPEAMMGPSFQMSYAAIVALVVVYERWRLHGGGSRDQGIVRRVATYLGGIAIMSVVASAASAVFAIYHFQQSAFYGLGANLIAVPIHDLWIMPFGIATYFLMPFGLEALTLKPMAWGIHGMLATARLFSGLPGAAGHFEAMPVSALALVVAGGLWVLLWTRKWRWLGLAPIAAGVLVTLTARQPDLLVSADGGLVAVRLDSGGIALFGGAHDKFTRSVWVRRAGEGELEDKPPPSLADAAGPEDCRKGLCRFSVAGHRAAIVTDASELGDGCEGVEVVISRVPAHGRCGAPLVIDAADIARDGATSVTFDAAGPHVATVRAVSGKRPWSGSVGR